MKKIVMSLVIALFTMNAMANQILWIGIDPSATIDFGNGNQMDIATADDTIFPSNSSYRLLNLSPLGLAVHFSQQTKIFVINKIAYGLV